MIVTQLDIANFRNIQQSTLEPHATLNLITGNNGSGKSSVLEAIQCIATGHSFRTRKPRELINHAEQAYQLNCTFTNSSTHAEHRAGLLRSRDGSVDLRLDYEELKAQSTITRLLPVKTMTPDSHWLITEGPEYRRQFLDWGLFHVEHGFHEHWRVFRRSLSQRNQLLRDQAPDREIETWNESFLTAANKIDSTRKLYLRRLEAAVQTRLQGMKLTFHVKLAYRQGWTESELLSELLIRNVQHHRRMKTTTDGPHRADMMIYADDALAKQVLSRGQLKVLVYALHLAQLDVLEQERSLSAIVLCDDINSELDDYHTDALIAQLSDLDSQVFVSGITLDRLSHYPHLGFHLDNGNIENRL